MQGVLKRTDSYISLDRIYELGHPLRDKINKDNLSRRSFTKTDISCLSCYHVKLNLPPRSHLSQRSATKPERKTKYYRLKTNDYLKATELTEDTEKKRNACQVAKTIKPCVASAKHGSLRRSSIGTTAAIFNQNIYPQNYARPHALLREAKQWGADFRGLFITTTLSFSRMRESIKAIPLPITIP
jgi:hypothetical protein